MKDAGSPRVGSGGTLPRMLAAKAQTNLFRKSGRGGKEHGGAPLPGLASCGRTGEPSVSQLRSSPPELRRGRGRGAAPAPLVRPKRPKIKKCGFPTPSPRCFFFPSALSLPLLKVNASLLAFSAFFLPQRSAQAVALPSLWLL